MHFSQLLDDLENSFEIQRMKSISSLGVVNRHPDLNRYNHSWGTFFITDDILKELTPKLIARKMHDNKKEEALLVASLLHDVGHAPLSHSFERVAQSMGQTKHHEEWTQEIILGNSEVNKILSSYRKDFPMAVADMLQPKNEKSFYHLLISSQVDVDRIDWLTRDSCYQKNVTAEFNYNKLKKAMMPVRLDNGKEAMAFYESANLELYKFFYSRYISYRENYFSLEQGELEYKTEAALLLASHLDKNKNHPLVKFFKSENNTLRNYLNLQEQEIIDLAQNHVPHMEFIEYQSSGNINDMKKLDEKISKGKFNKNKYYVNLSCSAYKGSKEPIYLKTNKNKLVNFDVINPGIKNLVFEKKFIVHYNPKLLLKEHFLLYSNLGNSKI